MITTTNETTIKTVAMRFLVRRQPAASRSSCCPPAATAIRHLASARAERSTIARAMTLTMMVKANKHTAIPISAERHTPLASPNWFAMTAGME